MKRLALSCLFIVISGAAVAEAVAAGSDFTKDQLAAGWTHCVHGFWLNEQIVKFYAGDTDQLNRDLPKFLEGQYASRKVVLHVGTKRAESPWDKKPRDIFADWSVNTYVDPEDALKGTVRMQMQIDVWLGNKITLKDIRIPDGFDVLSGGEIEKFIQQRKEQSK